MAMRFIPPYLFLSREDDDDVRVNIGKHDFRSVLLHLMLIKVFPWKSNLILCKLIHLFQETNKVAGHERENFDALVT